MVLRARAPSVVVLLFALVAHGPLTSCSPSAVTEGPSADTSDGGQSPAAPATEDAGADAADVAPVSASGYCEAVADFFCDFYLRCGRMVAADASECRRVFDETCNARYEPRYVDLESAKLLSLSQAGVETCAAHLASVACTEQPSDLGGPCAAMWQGTSPAGAPCGLDVESFVCALGTTCILGLDFCGTCEAAAPRGGACQPGGVRCGTEDACVEGTCVARALPGQTCDETKPCITGASCTEGTCASPTIVGEGAACDAKNRCAYRSYCEAGKCVRASLLGEPCTSTRACASGRCEGGECVPLRAEGEPCGAANECSSAQCVSGKCKALPSACFDER